MSETHVFGPSSVDGTLGAVLIGSTICSYLFGINSMQAYYYARHSKRDRIILKLAVALIWLLNLLQLVFTFNYLFYYGVTHYMKPPPLSNMYWSFVAGLTVPAFIYVVVSSIYSWRIFIVSGKNYFLALIPLLLSLISSASLLSAVVITESHGYMEFLSRADNMIIAFSSAVACDLFIASVLCYYLLRGKSGLKTSNSIVNTLILYIISTGLLTAIFHLTSLLTYVTMARHNIVYIGIYIITPELYTNALLATLNARSHLRNRSSDLGFNLPTLYPSDNRDVYSNTEPPTPAAAAVNRNRGLMVSPPPSFLSSESHAVSFSTIDPANSISLPWAYLDSPEIEVSDVHPAVSPSAALSEWKAQEIKS